ncbi:MAG: hypothetical protein NTW61_02260 [Candidatus Melainabacteria bacterium]|nr:hypothetical protein [Candidatus Melainabacteria bacterium]
MALLPCVVAWWFARKRLSFAWQIKWCVLSSVVSMMGIILCLVETGMQTEANAIFVPIIMSMQNKRTAFKARFAENLKIDGKHCQ